MAVSHCKVMAGLVTLSIIQMSRKTTNNSGAHGMGTTTTINSRCHLQAGNLHLQAWLALHVDLLHLRLDGPRYRLRILNLRSPMDTPNLDKAHQAMIAAGMITTAEILIEDIVMSLTVAIEENVNMEKSRIML
jgi:hypothetical protein